MEIHDIVFILCSARSNFEGSALGCINEKSEADSHLRAREDAASTLTRHGAARPGMAHRRVFTSIKENTSLKRDDLAFNIHQTPAGKICQIMWKASFARKDAC